MKKILLSALLVIVISGLFGYLLNLPEDAGEDIPEGKLNSLSFAPFRDGQNPLLLQFPTPAQIEEDMKLMADKTHTIRTYSSSAGMKVIPELAKKYGLQMIQGGWIGYEDVDNQLEMAELIKSANANPDVVKRVIVGNEVLLRGEMKSDQLIAYIRQVKQAVKQPVSYADVWSRYMQHPELIKEVDFITIHILPYWEDEPISVADAPAHIERIYQQVKKEADAIAPGKPILIGESGWPSEGRQRGWAIPSVVNEAAFIRGLLKVAKKNGFDVNIVEAFNQSWKSELEGVVGANWGLFSTDRDEIFPLTGKVQENIRWFGQFLLASLIMLAVAGIYAQAINNLSTGRLLFFLVFLQLMAWVLVFQADKSWHTSFDNWQRAKSGLNSIFILALAALIWQRLANILTGVKTNKYVANYLDWTYMVVVAAVLLKTYQLAVDGRYISFPLELGLLPVLGLLGLAGARKLAGTDGDMAGLNFNFSTLIGDSPNHYANNRHIAWLLWLYVFGLVIGEIKAFMVGHDFIEAYPDLIKRMGWAITYTLTNGQLVAWLFCLSVLALSLTWRNKH
jgi:exo-beta-1,3-glucanase (GH17 family)